MSEILRELSSAVATVGANFLIQSAVLIAAALLAVRFLSRSAVVRSAIYRATLVAVIVSPLACYALGRAGFSFAMLSLPRADSAAGLGEEMGAAMPLPVAPATGEIAADANEIIETLPSASTPPVKLRLTADRVYLGVALIWTAGSGLLMGYLLFCHLMVMRVQRRGRNVSDVATLGRLKDLCARFNVRPPRLLVSDRVKGPMLIGFARPAVVLPHLHEKELLKGAMDRVLIHEIAHLARRDCVWHLLARLLCAVGFFQPLAWLLARRLEEASDEVADDYVLSLDADGRSYARDLADIAERFLPTRREGVAGIGVIRFRSSLGRRVTRILDSARELAVRISWKGILSICTMAALATIAASTLSLSSGSKIAAAESAGSKETVEKVSPGKTPFWQHDVRDLAVEYVVSDGHVTETLVEMIKLLTGPEEWDVACIIGPSGAVDTGGATEQVFLGQEGGGLRDRVMAFRSGYLMVNHSRQEVHERVKEALALLRSKQADAPAVLAKKMADRGGPFVIPIAVVQGVKMDGMRSLWEHLRGAAAKAPDHLALVRALDERITAFSFEETPLGDVINFFKMLPQFEKVNFIIFPPEVARDKFVTLTMQDVSLRQALGAMLQPRGLDFMIWSKAIYISTEEGIAQIIAEMQEAEKRAQALRLQTETRPLTETERKIEAALDEKIEGFSFDETPLEDVINFFKMLPQFEKLNFVIDNQRLAGRGPFVTLTSNDVTLRQALDMMLRPRGLDFVIWSKAIYISTKEGIAQMRAEMQESETRAEARRLEARDRQMTETERKIEAALDEKIEPFSFEETPLGEVIRFFKLLPQFEKVNFAIDNQRLAGRETFVTLTLNDVTLRQALDMMLRPRGLDFAILNDGIFISTKEEIRRIAP